MGTRASTRIRTPDDTRPIQLNRQRIVSRFLEKREDDCDQICEPYFFLVILDGDLNAYDPYYHLFYRLKPTEPDEEIAYKEGDYLLFRKVDESYMPELEEDSIEPEVSILQDVDDETEIKAYMFFSEVVNSLFTQIYKDKIIYARTLIREMIEEIESDN